MSGRSLYSGNTSDFQSDARSSILLHRNKYHMNYSIAKMIEFAFTYIINNELTTKTYDMPDDKRLTIIKYMTQRIDEIRKVHK